MVFISFHTLVSEGKILVGEEIFTVVLLGALARLFLFVWVDGGVLCPVVDVGNHSNLHNHTEDSVRNPDWNCDPSLPASPAVSIVDSKHEHAKSNPVPSEWSEEGDGDNSLKD